MYRDSRTNGMIEKAFEIMPREEMYEITGNQFIELTPIPAEFGMDPLAGKDGPADVGRDDCLRQG